MIKKVFTYIAAILALTACTNDQLAELGLENVTPPSTPTTIVTPEDAPYGVYVDVPSEVLEGETNVTRSSLSYQFYPKKIMQFAWDSDDKLAVYAQTSGNPYYNRYQTFTQASGQTDQSSTRKRFNGPDDVEVLLAEQKYIACMPLPENTSTTYNAVPFNYDLQRQTSSVDMSVFPFSARQNKFNTTLAEYDDEMATKYYASEKEASAHLGKRDYLATVPTTTNTNGSILFDMERLGAIVRFYVKIPEKGIVYDSLQLVNTDVMFKLAGTMNLTNISTMLSEPTQAHYDEVFVPTVQRHVQSIKLAEKKGSETTASDGFDFSNTSDEKKYYIGGTNSGYFMAYMMMAPIDLSKVKNCTLYLCGHVKDSSPLVKKYFKATLSTKPNLTPNTFYQWSPSATPDEPITFEAIEIQKWEDATMDNGKDGTGTKPW